MRRSLPVERVFFYTTLAESNLLANLVPFVVALYAWVLFRERPDRRLLLPSLIAVCGLGMLTLVDASASAGHLLGDGLALATAFFYAAFLVVTKRLRRDYSATYIMSVLSIWCGMGCFLVAIIRDESLLPRTPIGWVIVVGLAVSSQLLGQTLMAHCVKYLSIQFAGLFILLQPVAAAAYSYVLFGESLTATQLLGIGLILIAIYRSKAILEV